MTPDSTQADIAQMKEDIAAIKETHTKILEIVETLKPEVMQVIDGLQANPMFKMLVGGKKNSA